jgi:hypothetical protein
VVITGYKCRPGAGWREAGERKEKQILLIKKNEAKKNNRDSNKHADNISFQRKSSILVVIVTSFLNHICAAFDPLTLQHRLTIIDLSIRNSLKRTEHHSTS